MNETTWIYGLLDPRDNRFGYIGASIDPVRRFRTHVSANQLRIGRMKQSGYPKERWVAELDILGMTPELVLLEEVEGQSKIQGRPLAEVKAAERKWILKLLSDGHPLRNLNLPSDAESKDEELFEQALKRGREMFG